MSITDLHTVPILEVLSDLKRLMEYILRLDLDLDQLTDSEEKNLS